MRVIEHQLSRGVALLCEPIGTDDCRPVARWWPARRCGVVIGRSATDRAITLARLVDALRERGADVRTSPAVPAVFCCGRWGGER